MVNTRIQEIYDTIGEDSALLDRTEKLNEEFLGKPLAKNSKGYQFIEIRRKKP